MKKNSHDSLESALFLSEELDSLVVLVVLKSYILYGVLTAKTAKKTCVGKGSVNESGAKAAGQQSQRQEHCQPLAVLLCE